MVSDMNWNGCPLSSESAKMALECFCAFEERRKGEGRRKKEERSNNAICDELPNGDGARLLFRNSPNRSQLGIDFAACWFFAISVLFGG
jgi:hypothetical protein